MNKYALVVSLFLLLPCHPLHGQSTFGFLNDSKSPKAASMGNNLVANNKGISSIYDNPATLSKQAHHQLLVSYEKFILDLHKGSIAYAHSFNSIGTFGISAYYVNYGSFERRDNIGRHIGSYSAHDFYFSITYAKQLIRTSGMAIQGGMSLAYIFSSIDRNHSSGIALDFGALVDFHQLNIQLGIAFLHLGGQLYSYQGMSESLPYDMRVGGRFKLLEAPITLSLGFTNLLDSHPYFFERFLNITASIEVSIENFLLLRAGYSNKNHNDFNFGQSSKGFHLGGLGLGIGGKFRNYKLAYSLQFLGILGISHHISFGIKIL